MKNIQHNYILLKKIILYYFFRLRKATIVYTRICTRRNRIKRVAFTLPLFCV